MHRQRVLVALVGLPLLVSLVVWGPPWLFALVIGAAGVGVQAEFYRMRQDRLGPTERRLALAFGLLLGLAPAGGDPGLVLAALAAGVLGLFLEALFRPEAARAAADRVALLVFGMAYGPLLLGHLTLARLLPGDLGAGAVLFALAAAWGGDTLAFYVGRSVGRRKLYPAVSPGKTWEGAVGGVAGSVLAMLIARALVLPDFPLAHLLVLGVLAAVLGQAGDLCESLLKRGAGVKDSGRLLPGHGGLLDRLDALLFVAPLVYYYVRILEG